MSIQQTRFDGFDGVELRTGCWRMVLVTDCGPRIAFLGRAEESRNILYWDKDAVTRGLWKLHGGHRVWLTRPYADESEDTYAEDNLPCLIHMGESVVTVTAPAHPFTRLVRGMRVEVVDENSFRVTNFIRNEGDMISSGGVWSPTCINPTDKIIRIPLGEEDSTWDIVKILIPRKFAGNIGRMDDPQVSFTADEMVVIPDGGLCKRCVCAPKGLISMDWLEAGLRFTKQVTYQRAARYPLDGCNIAVFVGQDNWMGELETYGPEQSIRPGETIENAELWRLEALPAPKP